MRASDKSMQASQQVHEMLGVNFHEFIEREDQSTAYELASEFGITLGDVKKLKKHLYKS